MRWEQAPPCGWILQYSLTEISEDKVVFFLKKWLFNNLIVFYLNQVWSDYMKIMYSDCIFWFYTYHCMPFNFTLYSQFTMFITILYYRIRKNTNRTIVHTFLWQVYLQCFILQSFRKVPLKVLWMFNGSSCFSVAWFDIEPFMVPSKEQTERKKKTYHLS